MLAPAEQNARQGEQPRRADIVVGVHGGADPGEVVRTGHRVGRQLATAWPEKQAVVLLLADGAGELPAPTATPAPGAPAAPVRLLARREPGQTDLEAVLRAAEGLDAAACALVAADRDDPGLLGARALVAPILEHGVDFVAPWYATQRFEGVLTTGIVYPVTRALFGKRLHQPIGTELAVSRRLAAHLLGEGWTADPAHAGAGLWLVTAVLSGDFELCETYLGPRPRALAGPPADLAAALAQVVGLLFHEMRLHAAAWQRVKGSRSVKTCGEPAPVPPDGGQPQVAPMLSAFQLGYQELGRLWSMVLPPQSLLALKRLASAREDGFAMDDALWARIVYDFAVGYHLAVMDRALLLRSMTPLYLGWAAGFVREVRDLDSAGVEARVERLCRAFEIAKPYLISRWRWPDRFNP